MEQKLSVLLVEDDNEICNEFIQYIDQFDDILCVGVTNNSKKAFELVKELSPDVIILELELNMGGGNGLTLLNELQQESLRVFPYILITTNNTSPVTYKFARDLGADFIIAKHQIDYSSENIINFLRSIKNRIIYNATVKGKKTDFELATDKFKEINKKICTELNYIGVSPKYVGYKYLVEAINILIKKQESNICKSIAIKYGKTSCSVERAMQNAISRTWHDSDANVLLYYYTAPINCNKGVPTLTEFINFYANKLKNIYLELDA